MIDPLFCMPPPPFPLTSVQHTTTLWLWSEIYLSLFCSQAAKHRPLKNFIIELAVNWVGHKHKMEVSERGLPQPSETSVTYFLNNRLFHSFCLRVCALSLPHHSGSSVQSVLLLLHLRQICRLFSARKGVEHSLHAPALACPFNL